MSAIRSILLHLDGSDNDARCGRVALGLALRHEARLSALLAVTPVTAQLPVALGGAGGVYPLIEELDKQRRQRARAAFDGLAGDGAPPMRWLELGVEPLIEGVVRRALTADLLVLGQHNPTDPNGGGVPPDFVESVLLASGRPALVVPYVAEHAQVGSEVLLAWKPGRESAHAVTAALPLLRGARRVHVVAASELGSDDRAQLADYLRLHGVGAAIEQHGPLSDVGNGLLSLAFDVNADLLVMGCYGHSRARELVLGGASRTVLSSMTLPVLMAH